MAETEWRAEPDKEIIYTNLWRVVIVESGETIASGLDEATARLIAAAPEMADALATLLSSGAVLTVLEDDTREQTTAALTKAGRTK